MLINFYYFRAHMYTLVPRHVREDMQWIADTGARAVTIGVLEQDLSAAVENMAIIGEEAARAGLALYATPSRWAGIIAGCPKTPSLFSCTRPEAVARHEDGSPHILGFGPAASVHHPATRAFFVESLRRLLDIAPITGIVWDEPKTLGLKDYSESARRALAGRDIDDVRTHVDATADFFDDVNGEILTIRDDIRLCLFLYAHLRGYAAERFARMSRLHDFGCDGRPCRAADGCGNDSGAGPAGKLLLDQGDYYIELARRAGKRPLFLIENHALSDSDLPAIDRGLPETLRMGAEHILLYYYPRSLRDPDRSMHLISRHLRRFLG
jgi:hypothetical protein